MSRRARGGAMGSLSQDLGDNTPSVDELMQQNVGPTNKQVIAINTKDIKPWKFANRPKGEFDLAGLVEEIRTVGQKVPVLVRPTKSGVYELIYGRRRYEACILSRVPVMAIVEDMNDAEAFSRQFAENIHRKKLSPFAQAMDFKRALDNKIYPSQSALAKALNYDRALISEYMCYFKFPTALTESIGDMTKVTLRTAKLIARNADNSELMATLIQRSSEIADGRLGDVAITKLMTQPTKGSESEKVVAAGKHGQLFSMASSRISLSKYSKKLATDEEIKKVLEDFLCDREQEMLARPTS